jgi:beta-carotene 3-hydroxylase
MMTSSIWIPVALAVAVAMEFWAALLHGRFWHGLLWPVHRSHHSKRRGRFEANDALSALHAPIAIAMILYGCVAAPSALREVLFGVGIGMTAFGVAYLVFHDGFVHGRLPVWWLGKVPLFARIRDAHRVHHGRGAAPYGFFLGPQELAAARARAGVTTTARARGRSPRPSGRPRRD